MTILDRALARQFLVNAAALALIVISFTVAVDAVMNLDRYANRAARLIETGAAPDVPRAALTAALVLDIWWPRLLQLLVYLNPLLLIAAAGFTCAQAVRTREFVAMLSGGISLHRAAAPILAVGALFFAGQALVQELALPRVGHLLARDPGDAGERSLRAFPLHLTPDESGRLWYARRFDDRAGVLEDPAVWTPDAAGRYSRAVVARRAAWDGRGWVLDQGLVLESADDAAGRAPQVVHRLDGGLDPARIKVRALKGFASTLSIRQITSLLESGADERTAAMLDRTRWGRASGLLSAFLAFWASTALFLVRAPRPMLGPALQAAPVAFGGIGAIATAASVSIPGLPLWLSAFVPTIILLAVAIALVTSVRT